MKRRIECDLCCMFLNHDGFQDMNFKCDVCLANPSIWDGLLDSEYNSRSYVKKHCPCFMSRKAFVAEARMKFKGDDEL